VRETTEHFKVRFGKDRDIKLRFTRNGPLVSDAINQLKTEAAMPLAPTGIKTEKHSPCAGLQDGDTAGIGIYEMGARRRCKNFVPRVQRFNLST
jgi:hypothetical protein